MLHVTVSNVCLCLSPAVQNIRLMSFACLFPLWLILSEGDLGNISPGKCYRVEHLAHYEQNADDRFNPHIAATIWRRWSLNVVHKY